MFQPLLPTKVSKIPSRLYDDKSLLEIFNVAPDAAGKNHKNHILTKLLCCELIHKTKFGNKTILCSIRSLGFRWVLGTNCHGLKNLECWNLMCGRPIWIKSQWHSKPRSNLSMWLSPGCYLWWKVYHVSDMQHEL